MKTVFVVIIVVVAINILVNVLFNQPDDTDKSFWERSGMRLYTDHRTGLQYLSTPGGLFGVQGTLIPRLDADGKHMRAKE